MPRLDQGDRLVVIGSSAGGIEALSTLVSTLEPSFPAPIVIAQHLDPRHTSHLGEILGRRTALTIDTIVGPTPLKAGVIYLVPEDRHVEITDHAATVLPAGDAGPKPSIDLLLGSAALAYGEGCVAVILTGSGSDGSAGALKVKAAGGTVIIQDPATASFPSMPRSLAPSSVDIVASLDVMGPVLTRLVSADGALGGEQDGDVSILLERLRMTNGIDFSTYKSPTILRRLQSRLVATNQPSVRYYTRYLESNPDEYQRLISSFLIKVTGFFRDPKVMRYLRDKIMPELAQEARSSGELRLWSAGCATGEEAYTLAILAADALGEDLGKIQVRIFATDLDSEALAFGRRGVYPQAALHDLSGKQRAAYFHDVDGEAEVSKEIRSMVVFGQHDLGVRAPFPRMDMILCRNVLIYFTREMQERALSVFAYSLREGGRLILGTSETVAPLAHAFVVEDQRLKVYRSVGEARIPGAVLSVRRHPLVPPRQTSLDRSIATTRVDRDRRRLSVEHAERVINDLPIGVAVVGPAYAILRINRMARDLLGIHGPALGHDLIHLAETLPTTELRSAIKAALAGETTAAIHEINGTDPSVPIIRYIQLTVRPHREPGSEISGAQLVFVDVTGPEQDRQAVAGLTAQVEEANQQRRRVVEANHALAAANDQLQIANEDFLFNAEEAQSSREEMETLAEELQATNEELETLNEELQATNEELQTANDDLATQTVELAEQQGELATGRDRLAAIIHGMSDALLVVDRDGQTVLSNESYDRLFGAAETMAVPEDALGVPLPRDQWPQELARVSEDFRTAFTLRHVDDGARSADRRWFEATGRRITFADQQWAGVVVIRDLTERSLRHLEEQFMAAASHELRTPIAALHAYAQLISRRLEAGGEQDGKIRDYAAGALAQTRTLGGLVDRLFDMSGLVAGRFQLDRTVLDLCAMAQRVVDVAHVVQADSVIVMDAPTTQVLVDADAGRIEQVLLGLLTNSIEHGGGTRIDVRVEGTADQATLSVTDDGRGIAASEQPKLFDRLQQIDQGRRSSRAGLGLGLYLAREILTAHGGTIELVSTEGAGTTVSLHLARVADGPV
ncbi:MAG: CheR family methyltransferase [Candidatus Limnocylindrales bacterium]